MRTLRFLLLMVFLLLAACQPAPVQTTAPTPGAVATQTVEQATPVILPSTTPLPSPTFTPEPGRAILVAPQPLDGYYSVLFAAWQTETAAQGYELIWNTQGSLNDSDVTPSLRLVLVAPGVLPPDALQTLAESAPQSHFIVFDQPGVNAGPNLSTVGPLRADQQGFIAGYTAALLTDDWRVGVLSPTDTAAGQAASAGFLNGAVFFCGLCNPYYGPIVDYPLAAGRPAAASSAEWVAAAQELIDQAVTTIFLGPGVNDPALIAFLKEKGVKIIGSQPVVADLADFWVLSVLPDDRPARALLPDILSGSPGQAVDFPAGLQDINPALLSPGRQAQLESIIADLHTGLINSGVESSP